MIDEEKIGEIKAFFKMNNNISATARAVGVSRSTVSGVIQGKRAPKKSRRPSPKVKARLRLLRNLAKQTSRKGSRVWPTYGSARKLRQELFRRTGEMMSVRQVQRDLHKAELKPYKRQTTPTRKAHETLTKKRFCIKHRNIKWKRLVFSDESWLTCNEQTGHVQWCSCRSEVLPREAKCRWNVPSVMVWAAVGWGYKSELVIFPAKTNDDGEVKAFRLDQERYVRRCLSTVMPQIVKKKRIFQQDGARSHMASGTRKYLQGKKVEWLEDWPPYSPDFNMIEPIWKELQDRVGQECPMDTQELIVAAKKAWKELPQSIIDAHCAHFPNALRTFSRRH